MSEVNKKNYALLLEYNGAGFHGWQKQPKLRTIQSVLHETIEMVLGSPIKKVTASGRTDVGVHAHAQVANFATEINLIPEEFALSVSGILKPELVVHKCVEVPSEFDACQDAIRKTYQYLILNRQMPAVLDHQRVWHVIKALDLDLMRAQAAILCGKHDFSAFRATDCMATSAVKTIEKIEIIYESDKVKIEITGSGFLKQMVRNIVGTLVDLNRGKIQHSIKDILESRDRKLAGVTAPAQGLYVKKVEYDPCPFKT